MTYYVLVPTTEPRGIEYKKLSSLGSTLLERLSKKKSREVYPTLLTFKDRDILRSLGNDDTLYITAHGSAKNIGSSNDDLCYSAEALAEALQEANLAPTIRTIKLMTCYSGVQKEDAPILHPTCPKLAEELERQQFSFAELFQIKLTSLGYPFTDVCGYIGEVAEAKSKRRVMESCIIYLAGAHTMRAKDGQQWFFGRHHSEEEREQRVEENEMITDMAKMRI